MLNKNVKRSLKVLLPITLFAITANAYVNSDIFNTHLKYILNNVAGINIDFSDVKFKRFSQLEITDIDLKLQNNEDAIKAKKMIVDINLMAPTRIKNLVVEDGFIRFERNEDKISLMNILKPRDVVNYKKSSMLGKMILKNINLKYIDNSFKETIEKDFTNVNGYMINNLQNTLDLSVSADSIGEYSKEKEKLDLKILMKKYNKKSNIFDMFSLNSREFSEKDRLSMHFKFDNFDINNNLAQYVEPLQNIIKYEKGKLNGNFGFSFNDNDKIEFDGNLKITKANVRYTDFYDTLKDVQADINFDKYKINMKAINNKVDDGNMDLDLIFDMEKNQLDLDMKLNDVKYTTLNKYSLINKFNLGNLKSDNIDSDLKVGINISNNGYTLNKFSGIVKTKYLDFKGVDILNPNITLGLEKPDIIKLNTNNFGIYKNLGKNSINADANIDFKYDIKTFNGDASFNVYNKSNFINLDTIKGKINIKENKKVDIKVQNSKIDILSNVDLEKNILILDTKTNEMLNIKYNDFDVNLNLNTNKLVYDIKNMQVLSGNIKVNSSLNNVKYFDKLNANLDVKNNNVYSKGNITYKNGSVDFDGINNHFNLKTNNFDVNSYLNDIGINKPDKLSVSNLNVGANLTINKGKNDINLLLNTNSKAHVLYDGNDIDINEINVSALYNTDKNKISDIKLNTKASMPNAKYFKNLKANIELKNNTYYINSELSKNDGNMIIKGHTTNDLIHSYDIKTNNFDIVDFIKGFDIKGLDDISSEKQDINLHLDGKNEGSNIYLSAKTSDDLSINYGDLKFDIKPDVNNLVFNTKNNSLSSGNININASMKEKKYFDDLKSQIFIDDSGYNVKAIIKSAGGLINLSGNTNRDLEHNYDIDAKGINVGLLLSNVDMLNKTKVEENKAILDFKTKVRGKGTNVSANLESQSEYGEFGNSLGYENLKADVNINNLLDIDADIDLSMDELWVKYQRFDNIKSKIKVTKDKVDVYNFGNDKLKVVADYTIKNKNVNLKANLNAYTVYDTSSLDTNLVVNNMNLELEGPIDNLKGDLSIDESPLMISSKEVGKLKFDSNIENSIINIEDFSLRDYNLTGDFNINTQNFDFNLKATEDDIKDIIRLNDLNLNIATDINIKGNLEKVNLDGKVEIKDLSYKEVKVPKVFLDLDYKDGKLTNLIKTGILNIKDFEVKNSKDQSIFSYKGEHDLSNLDINYEVHDKEIDLSKIEFLDNKKYSGKLKLDSIIRYNNEDMFGSIKIDSDELILNDFKVSNIDIDVQGNNEGINIPDIYFEYESNPLLVDGYMDYLLTDYNFRLIANDFNLKFLEISDKIEKSGGKINLNLYTSKNKFEGNINADNFSILTKDKKFSLNNIYSKINLNNNRIEIDEFRGEINDGSADIKGRIELPEIPQDFIKTKNIILKPIDLEANLNNVRINYGNDIMIKLTSDMVARDNVVRGNVIINEGEIYSIPSFGNKNSESNIIKNYITEVKNQILQNILKQYIFDLTLETEKYVKLNVPSAFSVVKKINGDAYGKSKLVIENGNINLEADLNINNGSFVLNGHEFRVVEGIIKNNGTINPDITFKAVTDISGDEITIGLNGKLSGTSLTLSSSENKDRNEILGLLAFDETGGVFNLNKLKATNILGKALETTLNNVLLSSITNKVSSTLGINEFKITTNFNSNESKNVNDIINNTITTLYIQNNVLNFSNLFWNAELKFPISASSKDSLRYNLWLNYNLRKSISTTFGVKTSVENKNSAAFYTGLQYSNKFNYFQEMYEDIVNIFRKKTELKK